jgi:hypothetical protein
MRAGWAAPLVARPAKQARPSRLARIAPGQSHPVRAVDPRATRFRSLARPKVRRPPAQQARPTDWRSEVWRPNRQRRHVPRPLAHSTGQARPDQQARPNRRPRNPSRPRSVPKAPPSPDLEPGMACGQRHIRDRTPARIAGHTPGRSLAPARRGRPDRRRTGRLGPNPRRWELPGRWDLAGRHSRGRYPAAGGWSYCLAVPSQRPTESPALPPPRRPPRVPRYFPWRPSRGSAAAVGLQMREP